MSLKLSAERYHDFSMGHKVTGHESKCAHLHGHNYRCHFSVKSVNGLDKVGRVIDFSVIKTKLCQWLEDNWDHKFLIFKDDRMAKKLKAMDPKGVVIVNFNPTAENMADHLLFVISVKQLKDTGCIVTKIVLEETRKCSVTYER